MNARLVLELPKGTMGVFVNYVYADSDGVMMASTNIDGDALMDGYKICKGAEGYEESTEV